MTQTRQHWECRPEGREIAAPWAGAASRPMTKMEFIAMRNVQLITGLAACAIIVTLALGSGARADEPKAYMIGLVRIEHKDWVAEYRPRTAALLRKYGGRVLARGKPIAVLEGTAPNAHAILVVEFPSVEKAKGWYSDPKYQPLIELRQSGADVDFVLVEELTR